MTRPELCMWLILAVLLWINADVSTVYHGHDSNIHDSLTSLGAGVAAVAFIRHWWDRKAT